MQNKTNSAEAQTESEPNVQALAPSMASDETKELDKNIEAIDGCQQRSCSASEELDKLCEGSRTGVNRRIMFSNFCQRFVPKRIQLFLSKFNINNHAKLGENSFGHNQTRLQLEELTNKVERLGRGLLDGVGHMVVVAGKGSDYHKCKTSVK